MPALAEVIWVHAHAGGMCGPKLSPRFNTEADFMWVLHLQCQFAMQSLDLSHGVTGKMQKWGPSQSPQLLGDAGATGAGFFWVEAGEPGVPLLWEGDLDLAAKENQGLSTRVRRRWLGAARSSLAEEPRVLETLEESWRSKRYLLFLNTYHPELLELTGSL